MRPLAYALLQLTRRNRDGSYMTQRQRATMLLLMARQLHALGYTQMRVHDLKGQHVHRLLAKWRDEGLSPATARNRLAVLRWWAVKIGNPGALPKTNASYQLPPRHYTATVSKATTLPPDKLAQIGDPYVRMSLELQEAFGLRRKECLLLRPHQADQGQWLVLQGSWTKGGRPRVEPIRTGHQREVLDRAKALVGKAASLIPAHKNFKEQLNTYTYWVQKVGLEHMHGLRHTYAQDRYAALAGQAVPIAGGPQRRDMTPAQREVDRTARLIVSAELGHGRERITTAYLGR